MKRLIILNPQSRNGKANQLFDLQKADWEQCLGKFDLYRTSGPGDATKKVRSELKRGEVEQIIIAGGDGSINEAFLGYWEKNELINASVPLGIINFGTGGDFIRTVEASSDNYKESLIQNQFRKVDAAQVTDGIGENHLFLNIASVGMAGDMLQSLKSSRFQDGSAAYFYHTVKTLLKFKPKHATIELFLDEGQKESHEVDILNFFVCNGQYSGGGMKWAPNAELNDGLLRVTLIGGKRKLPLILQSRKLYSGDIESFPGAETYKVRKVIVKCNAPVSLETDGEIIENGNDNGNDICFQVIENVFPLVI